MRKFGRRKNQRKAFLKSLAANLILKEKIKITEERAKELRSFIERLISDAKTENLASRRQVARVLPPVAARKLTREISPRFKEKKGGYVRLTRLGQRLSDGARMVYLELIK